MSLLPPLAKGLLYSHSAVYEAGYMSEYTGRDLDQFMRPVTCLNIQAGIWASFKASYMFEYTSRDLGQFMRPIT